jgi:predicted secreted hydrolase
MKNRRYAERAKGGQARISPLLRISCLYPFCPVLTALFLLATLLLATTGPYRLALPGYRYEFPRDHFNHPEYQTEWWYYTGNLHTAAGRRFGFELTFFRQAVDRSTAPAPNIWDVQDIWMAHLALSDIDGGHFYHTERLNRSGAGTAGADPSTSRVWNGNWQARWQPDSPTQQLQAVADHFSFDLTAKSAKPPVIHGIDGVSQKAEGLGHASHYISLTRLITNGSVVIDGQRFTVDGTSWMDHEFFTHQLEANQTGWDWFSLQFADGSDLMLFRLRRKDGAADPYSSGTYQDAQGRTTHLTARDFSVTPGRTWTSPETSARYPIAWNVRIPSLGIDVALSTKLPQQELTGKIPGSPAYWEGAIDITGQKNHQPTRGVGYLEMTGYAGSVSMGAN